MKKTSQPKSVDQRLSRIEKSISGLAKMTKSVDGRTKAFGAALVQQKNDLTILISNQTNAVVSDITRRMDNKFADFEVVMDKKMDQKLVKLRDDMNKDFSKTVMPIIENHDHRLDRIDKNLGLPHIPIQLQQ